jgi:hypothetical protein
MRFIGGFQEYTEHSRPEYEHAYDQMEYGGDEHRKDNRST